MKSRDRIEYQRRYDELVNYFGRPHNAWTWNAFILHRRIVRILDGREPDPRRTNGEEPAA